MIVRLIMLVASGARAVTLAVAVAVALAAMALVFWASPAQAAHHHSNPVAEAATATRIAFDQFTLPNGLRVVVHTDRTVPLVALAVYYDVGSRLEPAGRSGFAHLFEHLMFSGSPHVPGGFIESLKEVGGTDINGITSYDYTRYFETVPREALARALYMESDRMGYLPLAVTQETLDRERNVIFNEKREREEVPGGTIDDAIRAALLPPDHPYQHSIIGSMTDLQRANLDDVRTWFIDHYGPNNAVLVLAGDIDLDTARPLVTTYFGDIPRSRAVGKPSVAVPTADSPRAVILHDRVGATQLYRLWAVPGENDPDLAALDVGATVLGGMTSSRLDRALVRDEQLATRASAGIESYQGISFFQIRIEVKPGIDTAKVEQRIDSLMAQYLRNGPSQQEVARTLGSDALWTMAGLEWLGGYVGKAAMLGEGAISNGDPDNYRRQLAASAAVTPGDVVSAMRRWLSRPPGHLTVLPGERHQIDTPPDIYTPPGPVAAHAGSIDTPPAPVPARGPMPDPGPPSRLPTLGVETTTLSNGIRVHFVSRPQVPTVRILLLFDVGNAADPLDRPGTQELMIGLIPEGTTTRSAQQIAQTQQRLGAIIGASAGRDLSMMSLQTLSPSLAPSIALMADMIRNPAFDAQALQRVRANQIMRIEEERNYPQALAGRILPPLLYGRTHPYGGTDYALGTAHDVADIGRAQLVAFHRRWYRPDRLEIVAVGATTLPELKALLEANLGDWRVPAEPAPTKDFSAASPAAAERIILIDRPGATQSQIFAGQLLALRGTDDITDLASAVDILGGDFLSRINSDLRVRKGWSYGAHLGIERGIDKLALRLSAPVETNHTGEAIAAIKADIDAFLTTEGVTTQELARSVRGNIQELGARFESAAMIQGELQRRVLYRLPDDDAQQQAEHYRRQTPSLLDAAARTHIAANRFIWVVVGDKAKLLPQLSRLGMPISVSDDDGAEAPQIPSH